jgi:hypothetical protein
MRGTFPGCCAWAGAAVISKTIISKQKRDREIIFFAPVFLLTIDHQDSPAFLLHSVLCAALIAGFPLARTS